MSLIQINKKFITEAKCLAYLKKLRWGKTVKCTHCGLENVKRLKSEARRIYGTTHKIYFILSNNNILINPTTSKLEKTMAEFVLCHPKHYLFVFDNMTKPAVAMPSPAKSKTKPVCLSVMDADRTISPPATAVDSCINTNLLVVGKLFNYDLFTKAYSSFNRHLESSVIGIGAKESYYHRNGTN